MSNYGSSHRQLVEDSNKGMIVQDKAKGAAPTGQVQAQEVIGNPSKNRDLEVAKALVQTASQVMDPIAKNHLRKEKLNGYTAAGTEEGKKNADRESGFWTNVLFGPSASLQGAQKRISEDNTMDFYRDAQDELARGADAWDDKTWDKWRDKEVEDHINKYESEGMREHVANTLAPGLQKLEASRAYMHDQYVQVADLQATTKAVDKVNQVVIADLGAKGDPGRVESATDGFQKIIQILDESGISVPKRQQVLVDQAANEYAEGRSEMGKWAIESGLFDDLTLDQQQSLEGAQRIHEIKNNEDLRVQVDNLVGHKGTLEHGDVEESYESIDTLYASHPELAQVLGDKNTLRTAVHHKSWERQRAKEVAARRAQAGKQHAKTGRRQMIPTYNQWNERIGHTFSTDEEQRIGLDNHLAEVITAQKNKAWAKADATHVTRPLTAQELSEGIQNNSALVGDLISKNNIVPSAVTATVQSAMSTINSGMEGLGQQGFEHLKRQVQSVSMMAQASPSVRAAMFDAMGESFVEMEAADVAFRNPDMTPANYHNKRRFEADTAAKNTRIEAEGGEVNPQLTSRTDIDEEVRPSRGEVSKMRDITLTYANAGGNNVGGWFNNPENKGEVNNILSSYYAEGRNKGMSKEGSQAYAANKMIADSAFVDDASGNPVMFGSMQGAETQVREAGWDDFNEVMMHIGSQQANLDQINEKSGGALTLTASKGGNPLIVPGADLRVLSSGEIGVTFPVPGGTSVYQVYNMPHPSDPSSISPRAKREAAQHKVLNDNLHDSKKWKAITGEESPKKKFDDDIKDDIIREKYPEYVTKAMQASGKGRHEYGRAPSRLGGTMEELRALVTEEDIRNYIPAREYNAALMNFQQQELNDYVDQQKWKNDLEYFYQTVDPKTIRGGKTALMMRRKKAAGEMIEVPQEDVPYMKDGQTPQELDKIYSEIARRNNATKDEMTRHDAALLKKMAEEGLGIVPYLAGDR